MASEIAARIKADVIAAMKAKEKNKLGVLRMLQAALKQVEVDQRKELQDEDVLKILQSYAKKVKDAMQGARDAHRDDLVAENEKELAIVQTYLPAALDDDALESVVREAIAEVGATSPKDMGKVMPVAMAKVMGRAEGGRVSGIVKKLLQS